jgi:hypothetical protein
MDPQKQPERKALPAHILRQVEQCGYSAHLSQTYREIAEDKHGTRDVRTEVKRSWAVQDQAQLPDAYAAQMWLMSIGGGNVGTVRSVGESLGLIDAETGDVLADGPTDAVIDTADGEVLVVSWVVGEHYNMPEPEEDTGLVAMGLAACNGKPFKVAHVYLQDGEAFPRRSPVYPVDKHPALLARIRKAASAPRDKKCTGTWCAHCKQAQYCTAWLARAQAATVAMTAELVLNGDGEVEAAPGFELTNENASAFYERLEIVGKACEFGDSLAKSFVRKGGRIVFDGKMMYMAQRNGRKTVSVDDFKMSLTKLIDTLKAASPVDAKALELATGMLSLIKSGNAGDAKAWKAPEGGQR